MEGSLSDVVSDILEAHLDCLFQFSKMYSYTAIRSLFGSEKRCISVPDKEGSSVSIMLVLLAVFDTIDY